MPARAALGRIAIEDAHLRGKWLHLITPREVSAVGTFDSGQRGVPDSRVPNAVEEEDDVRVVPLR